MHFRCGWAAAARLLVYRIDCPGLPRKVPGLLVGDFDALHKLRENPLQVLYFDQIGLARGAFQIPSDLGDAFALRLGW